MSGTDLSDPYETDIAAMLNDPELVKRCFRKIALAFLTARGNVEHVHQFADIDTDTDHGLRRLVEERVRGRLTFPYAVTIDESVDPTRLLPFREESWWERAGIRREALQFVDDEGILAKPGDVIHVGVMRCPSHVHLPVEAMVRQGVRPLSVAELFAFREQHPAQGYLVAAFGSTLVANGDPYIAYYTRMGNLCLWQRDRQDEGVTFTVVADPHGRWKPWKDLRPPLPRGGF